jgi:hypothetical protein
MSAPPGGADTLNPVTYTLISDSMGHIDIY